MFTKLLSEVEFPDIVDFCREIPEGVRAEYKREIPAGGTIPKSVSSFANTLGGILLIGVETDENNNAILPIKGTLNARGIEERIVESAFTGIYPPVTPEVRVFDVPGEIKTGNIVVLVRVNESLEAPHAIQNSTKVLIRVGSTTQLANIDRIKYMLERREKPQVLADQIVNRIEDREQSRPSSGGLSLTIIARPSFPYKPLISPTQIYEYIRSPAQQRRGHILFAPTFTRQVAGGVCYNGIPLYQELNEHGFIYYKRELNRKRFQARHGPAHDEKPQYLTLDELVRNHCDLIAIARDFYETCQYLGNVEITARMFDVRRERLVLGEEPHYAPIQEQESLDREIFASTECYARDLIEPNRSTNAIVDLVGQLLWGFNVNDGTWEKQVRTMIEKWK